jgi:hypothetical protein
MIDPRAGRGPGIGGFDSDSEIVAFKPGHPERDLEGRLRYSCVQLRG